MLNFANKSRAWNTADRQHPKHSRTPDINTDVRLKKESGCACGGGCPACLEKGGNLRVSQPTHTAEIEADQIADKVMRMPSGETTVVESSKKSSGAIQRKCSACEDDEKIVQRKSVSSSSGLPSQSPAHVGNAVSSGGHSLDNETRGFFESRMNHDFGNVRVHDNSSAAQSARAINAYAYTLGNNIVFGKNEYQPNTQKGKRLLAHELAHVLQKNNSIHRYTIEDCPEDADTLIGETIPKSIEMLEHAIAKLEEDPISAEVQRHFANHFGAYAGWRNWIVRDKLNSILGIMQSSDIDFECETDCADAPSTAAYVLAPSPVGDVHLCLPWLSTQGINERAETFIHELFHWRLGMVDFGDYHKNNEDNDTSWPIAVSTPDAYSEFVQDLFEHT
jgi:Domain of unknown function (DUF4157)